MKNMNPAVTRPASIVTKTVSNNIRQGMVMPGNAGPQCCNLPTSEKLGNGVSRDVYLQSSRTVFPDALSPSRPTEQKVTNDR